MDNYKVERFLRHIVDIRKIIFNEGMAIVHDRAK